MFGEVSGIIYFQKLSLDLFKLFLAPLGLEPGVANLGNDQVASFELIAIVSLIFNVVQFFVQKDILPGQFVEQADFSFDRLCSLSGGLEYPVYLLRGNARAI